MNFHENLSSGEGLFTRMDRERERDRQTDMTKLIVTFRNFANAHNTNLKEIVCGLNSSRTG